MPYQINEDECTACGTCADVCPASAIRPNNRVYQVDADACLDCGACESACATGAPHPID